MSESRQISNAEIDGRIMEIVRQRDEALGRLAMLAGVNAELMRQIQELKERPNPEDAETGA